jgi:hypothetical protein
MARGGGKPARGRPQEVTKAGVKREDGWLYFIDKQGDVSRTRMARRGGRGRGPARRRAAKRRPARRSTLRRATARRRTARRTTRRVARRR